MNDEFLVYVNPIGRNSMEYYEYDFYFSYTPDTVWGFGWEGDYANVSECEPPDVKMCSSIKRIKTQIPLQCAQFNNSYGMKHAVEDIISISFEDISEYESYPEPYRIVFHYGEDYKSIETKLASRSQLFDEEEMEDNQA